MVWCEGSGGMYECECLGVLYVLYVMWGRVCVCVCVVGEKYIRVCVCGICVIS